MISVDLMSLWAFVSSVLLCYSVRKRILETCGGGFSLTELTEHLSQSKRLNRYEAGYRLMGKIASDDAIN